MNEEDYKKILSRSIHHAKKEAKMKLARIYFDKIKKEMKTSLDKEHFQDVKKELMNTLTSLNKDINRCGTEEEVWQIVHSAQEN